MKLLCTESDVDVCSEIIRKLADAGIEAETRRREPSLFDNREQNANTALQEIWILDEDKADKAQAILYPEAD